MDFLGWEGVATLIGVVFVVVLMIWFFARMMD